MTQALSAVVIVLIGLAPSAAGAGRAPMAPLVGPIEIDGATRTVRLHRCRVRSPHYRLLFAEADGTLRAIPPGPENTFRGTIVGDPGSVVAAAMLPGGLHATIVPSAAPAAGSLHVAELGIDADFEYFQRWGDETEARVNAIVNAVNAQYERDVGITHEISAIIVRRSPTYTTNDAIALLEQFRARWLDEHADIPRDLAHLLTGRSLNGGVIGAGFTAAVCTDHGFSLARSDFNGIFACATDLTARELGLTWGATHCTCPGTTMGFPLSCANVFAEESIEEIIAHRDTRDCLDARGACPEDIDGGGDVGLSDLLRVLAAWGPCGACPEDLDRSGTVDLDDLLRVLASWGPCA